MPNGLGGRGMSGAVPGDSMSECLICTDGLGKPGEHRYRVDPVGSFDWLGELCVDCGGRCSNAPTGRPVSPVAATPSTPSDGSFTRTPRPTSGVTRPAEPRRVLGMPPRRPAPVRRRGRHRAGRPGAHDGSRPRQGLTPRRPLDIRTTPWSGPSAGPRRVRPAAPHAPRPPEPFRRCERRSARLTGLNYQVILPRAG
jgi:hypothetical protein